MPSTKKIESSSKKVASTSKQVAASKKASAPSKKAASTSKKVAASKKVASTSKKVAASKKLASTSKKESSKISGAAQASQWQYFAPVNTDFGYNQLDQLGTGMYSFSKKAGKKIKERQVQLQARITSKNSYPKKFPGQINRYFNWFVVEDGRTPRQRGVPREDPKYVLMWNDNDGKQYFWTNGNRGKHTERDPKDLKGQLWTATYKLKHFPINQRNQTYWIENTGTKRIPKTFLKGDLPNVVELLLGDATNEPENFIKCFKKIEEYLFPEIADGIAVGTANGVGGWRRIFGNVSELLNLKLALMLGDYVALANLIQKKQEQENGPNIQLQPVRNVNDIAREMDNYRITPQMQLQQNRHSPHVGLMPDARRNLFMDNPFFNFHDVDNLSEADRQLLSTYPQSAELLTRLSPRQAVDFIRQEPARSPTPNNSPLFRETEIRRRSSPRGRHVYNPPFGNSPIATQLEEEPFLNFYLRDDGTPTVSRQGSRTSNRLSQKMSRMTPEVNEAAERIVNVDSPRSTRSRTPAPENLRRSRSQAPEQPRKRPRTQEEIQKEREVLERLQNTTSDEMDEFFENL